jgi:hypothetical protein
MCYILIGLSSFEQLLFVCGKEHPHTVLFVRYCIPAFCVCWTLNNFSFAKTFEFGCTACPMVYALPAVPSDLVLALMYFLFA